MNWLVFGAGAIGTYLGGSLQLHDHKVTFLERTSTAAEIKQRGLHLLLESGEQQHVHDPSLSCSLEDAFQFGPYDAAIFALKSFDTASVLDELVPHKHSIPSIICFQNGVENESKLASVLGSDHVIAGTVTSAVNRRLAGDIILERSRGIGISNQHPLSQVFADAFSKSGLTTRLYTRSADMKWSKMLTNLVANATSAILDLTPAQVFAHPQLYDLEIRQLREALAVMHALDIQVVNLPKMPVQLLGLAARYLPSWMAHPLLQRAVGGGRGEKMPSFHIDLHSGRGQSEVDYLNGAVVRAGHQIGVPTPVNKLLNQTLLDLTAGTIPQEFLAHNPKALLEMLAG